METLARDLRVALRGMARHRAVTAVALLTLALGIGANVAIFSVVEGVLLRSLPYREPERLVTVFETRPEWRSKDPGAGQTEPLPMPLSATVRVPSAVRTVTARRRDAKSATR